MPEASTLQNKKRRIAKAANKGLSYTSRQSKSMRLGNTPRGSARRARRVHLQSSR